MVIYQEPKLPHVLEAHTVCEEGLAPQQGGWAPVQHLCISEAHALTNGASKQLTQENFSRAKCKDPSLSLKIPQKREL